MFSKKAIQTVMKKGENMRMLVRLEAVIVIILIVDSKKV